VDPHLKGFWSKKQYQKNAISQGLMTKDGQVIKSLKQKDLVLFHSKLLSYQQEEDQRRRERELNETRKREQVF
jgi:hypothetical protein